MVVIGLAFDRVNRFVVSFDDDTCSYSVTVIINPVHALVQLPNIIVGWSSCHILITNRVARLLVQITSTSQFGLKGFSRKMHKSPNAKFIIVSRGGDKAAIGREPF